jgi:hypothetical protein
MYFHMYRASKPLKCCSALRIPLTIAPIAPPTIA